MVLVAAPPRAFRSGVAAALCALWLAASSASVAGLDEATALLKAGQHEQALQQVNRLLAANPKDPEARFVKGVILTERGDSQAAADLFERLTQDYPALPEPYNNLAVIYASQGRYDQARVALEKSIRTHPSYATAYENLGDVYSKLAGDAYDRALRLDGSDAGARKKLALVRELTAPEQAMPVRVASRDATPPPAAPAKQPMPPPTTAAAAVKPTPPAAAAPAKPAPAKPPPAIATATPPPTPITAAPGAASKPTLVASARPVPVKAAPAPSPDASALRSVKAWAQAWSAKDVDAYLAFYAAEFKTPNGTSRAEWEKTRRARISGPRSIKVSIRDAKVLRRDDQHVAVIFQQNYRSDRFQGRTRKTLELVRVADEWRILEEVVTK
ncbi:MAG: hypothetical protein AMJ64_14755 [Betaproteobacteria bacterium SG8_39]|nr:MAG: hypothetical protein AMJ64_14755 [Betaproteobacteria bacterium SG8_39]